MSEQKVKNIKPKLRRRTKSEVFAILNSEHSTNFLAKKHGMSRNTVNKIKRGERYKDWYREFVASSRGEIQSHLEALPKLTSLSAYYWLDNHVMHIAFDDLLVSVDLKNKALVSLDFNVKKVKGVRLEYDEALIKLDQFGLLTL